MRCSFQLLIAAFLAWPSFTVSADAGKAKFNKVVAPGDAAPAWTDLIGVDGRKHALKDYQDAKVLVVVFTCNHCPVAKTYEDRVIELANKYAERGVKLVAINVNRIEADRLDAMRERAKEKKYPFPYLFDESQQSAKAYGATVTPHFFVLDGKRRFVYMGAFDDDMDSAAAQEHYVIDAVESALAGKVPAVRESLQRGCGILYE